MVFSSSSQAELFVLVGATGQQGKSIIDAIRNDKHEYRVRALTRDGKRATAIALQKENIEVIQADNEDEASIEAAFRGANIVFALTTRDWTLDAEEGLAKEIQQGKTLALKAKEAGAHTFVWSGLPQPKQLSYNEKGPYLFDAKTPVVQFARSLGQMTVIDLHLGAFLSNFWGNQAPRRLPDGSYILPLAFDENMKLPLIDVAAELGKYVLGAVQKKVETVLVSSEYVTPPQVAQACSEVTGYDIQYKRVPDSVVHSKLEGIGGKVRADCLVNTYRVYGKHGYFSNPNLGPSQTLLSSPARTLYEALNANKSLLLDAINVQSA